ncbi:Spy/CpxP family protein refolding chaperone [Pseudoduganella violacea]|uniref:Spy/CpxP family protein refolding chaperone n=1 Tax=Pseudoduganella violacea TaxID=1715466 RepID=A0A7W5BC12_9BURK|nr:periplasmic heavy metal sensor [Pseudoduganella violacea]MBB3120101.1 Spy/CpxP family protein refolding chaperone [Pseudoduganella violacea]
MKNTKQALQGFALAASLALPLGAFAAGEAPPRGMQRGGPEMSPPDGGFESLPEEQGGMKGPGFPPPGGSHRGPGPRGEPPFLHGLQLSEVQQDKVFAILHAQAPYLREQAKAHEKAARALHDMRLADKYDDAAAARQAQAAAQAMANMQLQRVRTDQKLLSLLTPEQRKQIEERGTARPPRP